MLYKMGIGAPVGGLERRHNKFAACIGFGRHEGVDVAVDLPTWC